MDGQAILTVTGAVVALTQMIKWAGVQDKWGPIAVLVLAAIGVSVWGYSVGNYERTKMFEYFAGWVSVALSAAGVYGFTRATASSVTSAAPPPYTGAGSSTTIKE